MNDPSDRERALDALLGADADVEPSQDFDARFFAALEAEKQAQRPHAWTRWLRTAWLAPTAAVFVALIGVVVLQTREPDAEELFMAEQAEMLAELDLLRDLDAAEDFEVIASLQGLEQGETP